MLYTVQMTETERTLQASAETWRQVADRLGVEGRRIVPKITNALTVQPDGAAIRITFPADEAATVMRAGGQ